MLCSWMGDATKSGAYYPLNAYKRYDKWMAQPATMQLVWVT